MKKYEKIILSKNRKPLAMGSSLAKQPQVQIENFEKFAKSSIKSVFGISMIIEG